LSPEAIRVVTQKIVDLKVATFEGESILLTCKYVCAGLKWLATINKLPADPKTIVMNIMEVCMVSESVRYLESLKTFAELNNQAITEQSIMTIAESKYRDLALQKRWDISGTASTCNLQQSSTSTSPHTTFLPKKKNPIWDPPNENESEVKQIYNDKYKFCSKCQHWNKGDKGHTTSDHVIGYTKKRQTPAERTMVRLDTQTVSLTTFAV
jgi:hypothetical protein